MPTLHEVWNTHELMKSIEALMVMTWVGLGEGRVEIISADQFN